MDIFQADPQHKIKPGKDKAAQRAEGRLADFIVNTSFKDLPDAVVERSKAQIAYHLGLAFAGFFNLEGEQMQRAVSSYEHPSGASVIGAPYRLQTADAVFANTTLMRAIWRDDVLFPGGVHPGIMSIPPALAFAEMRGASGEELLLAVALSYEVLGKLSAARGGWTAPFPRRPTMIFGGFGSLTAASCLLKFNKEETMRAMAYAANFCAGVPEGGQVDHFYSLINRNGAFAAEIVKAGGAPYGNSIIEGDTGLYHSFFGEVPKSLPDLIDSLGQDWEILRAEYKRHHGTGQNTIAIELMRTLTKTHGLTPENVAEFRVYIDPERRHRGENLFKGPFQNESEAYSSMPYALALAHLYDEVSPDNYTPETINDDKAKAVIDKIFIQFEDGHDVQRYCRIEVDRKDGQSFSKASDGFTFPFPPAEWGDWLRKDGKRLYDSAQLSELENVVLHLEALDNVKDLAALLGKS